MSRPITPTRLSQNIQAKGYTRISFAAKFGFSATQLSSLSTGSTVPTLGLALRIANALRCKIGDLFSSFSIAGVTYSSRELKDQLKV